MNDRASGSGQPSGKAQQPASGQTSDDIRRTVLTETTRSIVLWLILTSAGFIGLALTGWWLYLKPYMIEELGAVPRGAVLAFDRADLTQDDCPEGWSPFKEGRGRAIVGAGDPSAASGSFGFDMNEARLANRSLRDHGGTETHTLLPNEIPRHQHPIVWPGSGRYFEWGYDVGGNGHPARILVEDGPPFEGRTGKLTAGPQEQDQPQIPHNNMPPYIALYLCKKN